MKVVLEEAVLACLRDFSACLHDFFEGIPFRNLFFLFFQPKDLRKWSQNEPKIYEKVLPTTLPKNTHTKTTKLLSFFGFCDKVDVHETVKTNTKQ